MSFAQTVLVTRCAFCEFFDPINDECSGVEGYMAVDPEYIHADCPEDNKPENISVITEHPVSIKDAHKAPYITGEDIKNLDGALGQGGPFRWG